MQCRVFLQVASEGQASATEYSPDCFARNTVSKWNYISWRRRMGFFSRTFGRKDAEQSQPTSPALDSGVAPPPAPEMSADSSFSIPSV